MIFVPPAAPTPNKKLPSQSVNIVGLIDDTGLLPGSMKLFFNGGDPLLFVLFGIEKSAIWLLKMMPVLGDIKPEPNLKR